MAGFRRRKDKVRAPRSRAAPFRCRLVVMAKAPVAGRVKTRLARELGVATATHFARHATAALLASLSRHTRWHTWIAVAPDCAVTWRLWPPRIARVAQGKGDLGARMQRIMCSTPPGPVVIIGTDIPAIRSAHIAEAFRLLGRHDAVLGPAGDGGYWLVGLRRRPRLLTPFEAVRWSTPHALADTLANLNGYSIARLSTLSDVDNAQDYRLQSACSGRRVRSPQT
jgi:rSAM/selenodomain-associated transferase 1